MPVYEYACRDCADHVEVRATIAEKEAGLEPMCPRCGSASMQRLLTVFATRSAGAPAPAASGGGCCGGGCCSA